MEREKCQNVFQQIRRREYGIKQGPRSKFEILKTLLLYVSTGFFFPTLEITLVSQFSYRFCYVTLAVAVTVKYTWLNIPGTCS